jgi:hypothetical protein
LKPRRQDFRPLFEELMVKTEGCRELGERVRRGSEKPAAWGGDGSAGEGVEVDEGEDSADGGSKGALKLQVQAT